MRTFAQEQNHPLQRASPSLARSDAATPRLSKEANPILRLQTRRIGPGNSGQTSVPPIVVDELRSSGRSLDPASSASMAPRFGHDFGRVVVHGDARAAESAGAVTALTYTRRRDGVSGSGESSPQTNRGHQLPAHDLTPLSENRIPTRLSSNRNLLVQGRIGPPGDPIHGPLLDRYSQETGLPRDTVTQHDPGFQAWLLGRPIVPPPINVTLDMPVPAATPAPDYSRDETQLGAWEKANFLLAIQSSFSCDHVINNGIESSFVTDIGIRFTQSTFEYFIARHIYENMNDLGKPVDERVTWRRIHLRVRQHAGEHFTRYRQVVSSMRQTILQRFAALPTRNSPIRIPQRELEAYVGALLVYLTARLHFELWQTTCNWEHQDYPNLLRGIQSVSGSFVPACDPQPRVPPEPIMPIVVTPGSPRRGSPARPTRP
jgi:hypothetical protein